LSLIKGGDLILKNDRILGARFVRHGLWDGYSGSIFTSILWLCVFMQNEKTGTFGSL